ncbi:unnamed protein product [Amoebophrya sp. A25]|nr:unnamed protein product [Amoebophrya sp. A25]|eukprot:GSA25T00020356001.1
MVLTTTALLGVSLCVSTATALSLAEKKARILGGSANMPQPVVQATAPTAMDPVSEDKLGDVRSFLAGECGEQCTSFWDNVMKVKKEKGQSLLQAMESLSGEVYSFVNEFNSAVRTNDFEQLEKDLGMLKEKSDQSSFLGSRSKAELAFLERPCFDKKSCSLVETLGNRCNFARVATLAVYQAINLPIHVMQVVGKLICGCVDVLTESKCFLFAFPPCPPLHTLSSRLAEASTQVWEGVKTVTSKCKGVGSPLVASPP